MFLKSIGNPRIRWAEEPALYHLYQNSENGGCFTEVRPPHPAAATGGDTSLLPLRARYAYPPCFA